MIAVRYRVEIIRSWINFLSLYAGAIGDELILMDDNAQPHRARLFDEYLEDQGLKRMERSPKSPDFRISIFETTSADKYLP